MEQLQEGAVMKKLFRYSHMVKLYNRSDIKCNISKIKAIVQYIKNAKINFYSFSYEYWALDWQIKPFEVTNIRYSRNGNTRAKALLLKVKSDKD